MAGCGLTFSLATYNPVHVLAPLSKQKRALSFSMLHESNTSIASYMWNVLWILSPSRPQL